MVWRHLGAPGLYIRSASCWERIKTHSCLALGVHPIVRIMFIMINSLRMNDAFAQRICTYTPSNTLLQQIIYLAHSREDEVAPLGPPSRLERAPYFETAWRSFFQRFVFAAHAMKDGIGLNFFFNNYLRICDDDAF